MDARAIPRSTGYYASREGDILTTSGGVMRPLKPERRKEDGRSRYTIAVAPGRYRRVYGSALVLEAWVGPRPPGMEACHNNGNCQDDRAENLRWDTPTANKADMRKHGTQVRGATHPKAKLSDGDVLGIIHRRGAGEKLRTLATDYGVSVARVSQIYRKGAR